MINLFKHLTGWWFQPLWNILVNGKDYPIYEMEIKKNWNHQSVIILDIILVYIYRIPYG
jgi:hypothetical protein